MGSDDRAPTPDDLDQMRRLVARAMEEGAFGLSTGLFYVPGSFTGTDEVIALAAVAARYGGASMRGPILSRLAEGCEG